VHGQSPVNREYRVKAAFLFHFTQFVEWPPSVLPADKSPLIIGVLGESPFDAYLEEAISEETVQGHPVTIRRYKDVAEIKTCHILYINLPSGTIQTVIPQLKGRSILTVSDKKGFLKAGGMIRLFSEDNKIRFKINQDAAQAERLVLSSKLLSLAEIYVSK
jgi:hypothetical protein